MVACKWPLIAADTQVTSNGLGSSRATKIFCTLWEKEVWLGGCAGDFIATTAFMKTAKGAKSLDDFRRAWAKAKEREAGKNSQGDNSWEAFLTKGEVERLGTKFYSWVGDAHGITEEWAPYMTIGSGGPVALGALWKGGTAIEAVHAACHFDPHSSAPVEWINETGKLFSV